MKRILLLFILNFCSYLFAQNVNIPDTEFKNVLLSSSPTNQIAKDATGNWVAIDTNGDSQIQLTEAQTIKYLNVIPPSGLFTFISSIEGIKSFSNADSIKIDFLEMIDEIDMSNMPNLKYLSADGNHQVLTTSFTGNIGLKTLSISGANVLTNLDLSSLVALEDLDAFGSNISNLNLTGCINLKNLDVSGNPITSLNIQPFTLLETLDVTGCYLQTLNASNLLFLKNLSCSDNELTTLNLQNTPQLLDLDASGNFLSTVNLSTSPLLKYIGLDDNELVNLDLTSNVDLEYLDLTYNFLTFLDLHNNIVLVEALLDDNNLQTLIIKNGIEEEIYYDYNPNLTYICTDDSEIPAITTYNTQLSLTNCVVNSYCTFTPGGLYYTVTGSTTVDLNNNGCDTTDPLQPFQKFNVSDGTTTNQVFGNPAGTYAIHLQQGTYTITPILENPTYFNVTPATVNVNFPTQTSPVNQNFCIAPAGTFNDLEVTIIPTNCAVPGFPANYILHFKNKGTTMLSGNVNLTYDDTLMDFTSSPVAPDSQSTGQLSWNFVDLPSMHSMSILATFTLNTPTATPPLNGGDILTFGSQVSSTATDETPTDNNFALNQTVVNSFDPNDKTCLEGSSIATTKVGDYVHYLVRFENTGTANAQNIVVKDLIDTTKFDLSSLVALNGSHSFITRITNPNTVEFIFENIQLPFANATNDGYVLFKIKTKSTLVLGDSFSNTANIYFDYNAPIVTNTYSTSVQNSLATDETEISNEFSIFPNPVSDFVSFKSPERIQKIEIFDLSGRIICANAVQNNSSDLSILSKGNYIIKAYSKQKTYIKKLIKK